MKAEIYSKDNCVFCTKAKMKLEKHNPKILMLNKDYTMEDFFNVGEVVLILLAGFFLLKFMFDFGAAMEAWSELDTLMRGY